MLSGAPDAISRIRRGSWMKQKSIVSCSTTPNSNKETVCFLMQENRLRIPCMQAVHRTLFQDVQSYSGSQSCAAG